MLKGIIMTLIASSTLVACSTDRAPSPKEPLIGMANPASEFCIKQGGKLEAQKDAQGNEYALCHLPDGTIVEEWAHFRKHHQ